jgi:hypothetical protein
LLILINFFVVFKYFFGEFCLFSFIVNDFIATQTSRMQALMEVDAKLSDSEVIKLGKKDADKFVFFVFY